MYMHINVCLVVCRFHASYCRELSLSLHRRERQIIKVWFQFNFQEFLLPSSHSTLHGTGSVRVCVYLFIFVVVCVCLSGGSVDVEKRSIYPLVVCMQTLPTACMILLFFFSPAIHITTSLNTYIYL
jgi:hypothetical protein